MPSKIGYIALDEGTVNMGAASVNDHLKVLWRPATVASADRVNEP